jgi:hypothetical protein
LDFPLAAADAVSQFPQRTASWALRQRILSRSIAQGHSVNATAMATTEQATVVCTEEERLKLIELRERPLSQAPMGLPKQSKPDKAHHD